jgi:hypothetical protein
MAGGMAVGFGAVKSANGAEAANGRHSDLPSKFTPAAYSLPSTKYSPFTTSDYYTYADDLVIERNSSGKPDQGRVLAAVEAHSDDIPLFAGGTVAKLIDEGYTGYLIRVSNDEAAGRTLGYGVVQNEKAIQGAAKALETKIDAIVECKLQGGGARGSELRARLAKQGRRLPLLGSDDQTADREYGKPYNLQWAERFTYVDERAPARSKVDEYVERNSVRI